MEFQAFTQNKIYGQIKKATSTKQKVKKSVQFVSPLPKKPNTIELTAEQIQKNQQKKSLVQKKKTIRPFKEDLFSKLSHLEDMVQSKNFNLQTIDELISIYSKLVEYYDSKRDPISKYFQDKMQNTLMNSMTLKIMFKNKAEKDSAKLSQATTRTSFDSQDLIDDNSTEYSSPSSRMDTEGSNSDDFSLVKEIVPVNFQKKKNKRSKCIELYQKIQKEESKQQNAVGIINKFENQQNQIQNIIQKDIDSQVQTLRQRLLEKKQRKQSFGSSNSSIQKIQQQFQIQQNNQQQQDISSKRQMTCSEILDEQ